MPLGVATLPLELLINLVSFLNFEDFVNLKSSEKALWRILQDESISREIVKVYIAPMMHTLLPLRSTTLADCMLCNLLGAYFLLKGGPTGRSACDQIRGSHPTNILSERKARASPSLFRADTGWRHFGRLSRGDFVLRRWGRNPHIRHTSSG